MNEEWDDANERVQNSEKLYAAKELVKLLQKMNRHGVSKSTMDAVAREWRIL